MFTMTTSSAEHYVIRALRVATISAIDVMKNIALPGGGLFLLQAMPMYFMVQGLR
jgi:hypothetical protein